MKRPSWRWTPLPTAGASSRSIYSLLLLLMILWACPRHSYGVSCGDAPASDFRNPKDGACSDIDIRNSVKNFRMLENCTVIEGSLHISLIDYVSMEEYDKYSFPQLREITGHLMMFRVFGLRTLRNIFPNLAVIRGQTLFFNDYALVAFEMRDLEELGLVGLTTILRGAVRLTKNPKLCHVSSIDWEKLAVGVTDQSEHQFVDNREEQLCPDFCSYSCPNSTYNGISRRRCWTSDPKDCQKNLVCKCAGKQPCAADGSCCHPYCLGGCFGPQSSDCYACKNVIYNDECKPVCPHGTFMLSQRRCLTDKECLRLQPRPPRDSSSDGTENEPKLLRGSNGQPSQCVFMCPPTYMAKATTGKNFTECVTCPDSCPKVCKTTEVESVEDSNKLFGCSKIDGNLEIRIMAGTDIDNQLTKNLGNIKEVTGFIKIMRSYALLTLHFFQSLEIIGGEKLAHDRYSLIVVDNLNLQEIFPEAQIKKMVIHKGAVRFHGNRKLCYYKIANFTKQVGITPQLDEKGINVDTSNTTNGDLIPCHHITLGLSIEIQERMVLLTFDTYSGGDMRQLISYFIHYKEVEEPVRDIFQGRDACSENEWETTEVKPNGEKNQTYFLVRLKAFTKYAVYVQAYTLPDASASAMTKIHYFRTSPFDPTEPIDLEVSSTDPHELIVKWKPPKEPNGIVTHYKVFYQLQSSNMKGFKQRDYCKDPIVTAKELEKEKEKKRQEEEKKKKEMERRLKHKCCYCPKTSDEIEEEQRMAALEIAFENHLHNSVYQKRWTGGDCAPEIDINKHINNLQQLGGGSMRRRRAIPYRPTNKGLDFNNPVTASDMPDNVNLTMAGGFVFPPVGFSPNFDDFKEWDFINRSANGPHSTSPFQEVIVYDTKVTLSNLDHFREYNIEVVACHETNPRTSKKLCGNSAITTGQTMADLAADKLNMSLVSVEVLPNKNGEVQIKWQPPPSPNGLILIYNVKYQRVDLDREAVPVTHCVNPQEYVNNSNGYLLKEMGVGNYSVQISAHSLAGNGSFTPPVYFSVLPPPGDGETSRHGLIVGVVLAVVAIIIGISVGVCRYVKVKYASGADVIVSPNPHYIPTDQLYAPDEWEVPRDTIRLIKELGQGSFGTVYEGLMEDPDTKITTPVAIKTVNDTADFHERLKILKEATTMKVFECHHVVKLLGVVSKGQPALVIMELMSLGDLRNYLRKCRADEEDYPDFLPPTSAQIRQMAGEIADGMAYLADKKIVHRDLAARNCLVAEDRTVKIADFGMARDVYLTEYYRKDQKALLPVRWMAPESLRDGIFTTMSDIWSYGIVLWEMVTLAEQPYQGLGNDEVLRYVTEGRVMSSPLGCPEDLYNMMQRCWAYNPKHRPTFKYLIELLVPYLSDQFREVSYFFQEVVRSDTEDAEDEEAMKDMREEDMEEYEEEEEEDDKTEVDRDFEEDEEKLMRGGSDGEDSLMAGGSPNFYANSTDDDEEEEDDDNQIDEDSDTNHHSNPYLMAGPARISPSPSSPTSSRLSAHHGGGGSLRGEHSPLLLHQGDIQEPSLYPASSLGTSRGPMIDPSDFDNDGDDDDSDREEKYVPPSKDAKSSSERLKLLSNTSDNSHPNLGSIPGLGSPSSYSKFGSPNADNDYTMMSPSPSASSSSKNPFLSHSSSSPPLPSSSSSPSTSQLQPSVTPATTLSSPPPPFSLLPLTPSIASHQPSSSQAATTTSPSSSSSSPSSSKPVLHVDMEGVGNSRGANPKSSPSSGGGKKSERGDTDKHNFLHQNNVLRKSSEGGSSNKKNPNTSSGSDSNTNSTQSGSEGSGCGSKESSSSSGSHHKFNPGTANGHGPFTHQQAALC